MVVVCTLVVLLSGVRFVEGGTHAPVRGVIRGTLLVVVMTGFISQETWVTVVALATYMLLVTC